MGEDLRTVVPTVADPVKVFADLPPLQPTSLITRKAEACLSG
jgi:hypothetical protein